MLLLVVLRSREGFAHDRVVRDMIIKSRKADNIEQG